MVEGLEFSLDDEVEVEGEGVGDGGVAEVAEEGAGFVGEALHLGFGVGDATALDGEINELLNFEARGFEGADAQGETTEMVEG